MKNWIVAIGLIGALSLGAMLSLRAVEGTEAQPKKGDARRIRELQAKHVQMLKEAVTMLLSARTGVDIDRALAVEHDLIKAQLDIATTQAERLDVLREQLRFARKVEDITLRQHESSRSDRAQAKAAILHAEITLLREQGR